MDCMDIDQVVDVPDTPDRIAAQNINDPSVTNTSVNKDFSDEGSRIRPRDKSKLFTDNGSKRPLFPPSKNLSISNKSSSSSGKSSSSKNPLPKRMVGDKTANHETKHSIHSQPMEKGKYLCTSQSQSSTSQEGNPVVDLTEQKGHFREHRKGPVSANSGSSLNTTPNPITSRRVAGQKRLVRNGCISPHNIAKAKQSAEVPDNSSIRDGQNDSGTVGSNGPLSVVNIRDLVAEANDSHRVKGKGIINYHLSSRSTTDLDEKADETIDSTGDASRFEGLGGWRSTRNRHLAIGKNDPSFVNQQNENGLVRRENRDGRQMGSHNRHQSGQFIEHKHSANALIKRQKQGSTSSNHGECFTPGFDDSELVCIGSSGESSSSRSTGDQSHHRVGVLEPVIEIDEFSPEIRNSVTSNAGCSSNDDSDVRARQVEADEMLARELQEELYNEVPGVGVGVGVGEIDARVALALQQEENLPHAFPSGTRAFPPRSSLRPNPYSGQSVSLSSRSPSVRRGTQARVPTSTRMARLRGRFPGQSRTISSSGQSRAISSRERSSMFPPSMDYEMRMHILQTLEAFNDMEMAGDFSRVQRDFNENDYEMLLALDENNHQHGGASLAQINGLPQSVVQTENLEEACAICLDTPSTGDTIRHLPCLHRFHKDCIDPWLQRKTSCPVCKSSIT